MRAAPTALLLLIAAGPGRAQEPSPPPPAAARDPVLREVVLEGVTLFSHEEVLKATRLRPGSRFRRQPAEVARSLYAHYYAADYIGVTVEGAFDASTGRLTLRVDEGPVAEVALEGLGEKEAARARELMGLEAGRTLRENDVREAITRLESRSGGAFRVEAAAPYPLEPGPDGTRLRLPVRTPAARVAPRPIGPDLSPFQNRVEGTAPGASLEATLFDHAGLNHTTFWARGAYGTASEEARYALGLSRSFGPGGHVVAGAEAHDLTDTDDRFRRRLIEEERGRSYLFSIVEDYHRRRGYEAFVFLRPFPRVHLGVSWRADRHEALDVAADDRLFLFATRAPRPNPPAGEGEMRSLILTARFAAGAPLYTSEARERRSFLAADPFGEPVTRAQRLRADLALEWADAETLGGVFDFTRMVAHLRATREVGARWTVNARALLGLTSGTPPPQRLFALGGAGTLRGYELEEIGGRHAALVTLEWMLHPPPCLPAPLAFYDGGIAWTPEVEGAGWKSGVGLGLEWPAGGSRARLRADVAFPLQPGPGRDRARLHALVRLPF